MSSNTSPTLFTRFKGVENFLRRVAFNLGNTPSQTEVKIISCIPIDVTDLQQKIISLEKQLDEAKSGTRESYTGVKTGPVVDSVLCRPGFSKHSNTCCKPNEVYAAVHKERCGGCSLSQNRLEIANPQAEAIFHSSDVSIYPEEDNFIPVKLQNSVQVQGCACWSSEAFNQEKTSDKKKSFFKKKKKSSKKTKEKTQFVYYAQAMNSPFNSYLDQDSNKINSTAESLSKSYISEMIRKQYKPVPLQDVSILSEFSSPICRDASTPGLLTLAKKLPNHNDSDLCSCCHGAFHNIDHHSRSNDGHLPSKTPFCAFKDFTNNTDFYDSSMYDMVPVRDKPAKITKQCYENKTHSQKEYSKRRPRNTAPMPTLYHPEHNIPFKTKLYPYIVNHYTAPTSTYPKKLQRTYNKPEKVYRPTPRRETLLNATEPSRSSCIDCGDVYLKRPSPNKLQLTKPITITTHKNAECLTSVSNETECQATTTQSVQINQVILEENKTEETLNQIKTMLQSVLTEVKTNTQSKIHSENKCTKDAVVQNGVSQGEQPGMLPGCSSLLHSFTYSPYNMDPYLASCSKQMMSGPCCFSRVPYHSKFLHNFPIFIQTPGRNMCSSCYRNSSHIPKMNQAKQATTAATNTDKERSKETEKLIKEIYKSITVNMDYPAKDTSASEYNGAKSTPRLSLNKSINRPSLLDEGAGKFTKRDASTNFQKTNSPQSSFNSKLMSNTLSMRSQVVTSDTERQTRNHRVENYLENANAHKRQNKIVEEYEEESPDTTASDEESSSSETEDVVYVPTGESSKKADPVIKKGLFSKMLQSVKMIGAKSKKKNDHIEVEDDESEENSDDYQTVYSQRVKRPTRYIGHKMDRTPRFVPYSTRSVRSPPKIKAHSKISYSRNMRDRFQEKPRRSPYMEQEYRRHWNEKLMFHENQRHSSDTPSSRETARRPVYWQNYEARNAVVNHHAGNIPPQSCDKPQINQRIVNPDYMRQVNVANSTPKATTKGLAWLKKHKLGIHCGEQWKKFILDG